MEVMGHPHISFLDTDIKLSFLIQFTCTLSPSKKHTATHSTQTIFPLYFIQQWFFYIWLGCMSILVCGFRLHTRQMLDHCGASLYEWVAHCWIHGMQTMHAALATLVYWKMAMRWHAIPKLRQTLGRGGSNTSIFCNEYVISEYVIRWICHEYASSYVNLALLR